MQVKEVENEYTCTFKGDKMLDMPPDFDTCSLSEPQSVCSSSTSLNVAQREALSSSSSDSDAEFIDDDAFTSVKRENFQQHFKKSLKVKNSKPANPT